jgi:hypothetical protein
METAFNTAKLEFFTEIRRDELVQSMGREQSIRDLVESMILYQDHVNHANLLFQNRKLAEARKDLGSIGQGFKRRGNQENIQKFEDASKRYEDIFDKRARPVVLDFSDIRSIAYTVGTYQDKRGWFEKICKPQNPLDARVNELSADYLNLHETGDVTVSDFDEDVQSDLIIACDPEADTDLRISSLNSLIKKGCEYMNRKGKLMQMADNMEIIHRYYAVERKDDRSRGFTGYGALEKERLTWRQTREIQEYFQRQGAIDGLHFKTLYHACSFMKGNPDPSDATERLHQEFIDSYRRDGYLLAAYAPADDVVTVEGL